MAVPRPQRSRAPLATAPLSTLGVARHAGRRGKSRFGFALVASLILAACTRPAEYRAADLQPTPIAAQPSPAPVVQRTLTELPASADAFVDSIGLTTHLFYNDTPYVTNFETIRRLLTGLHVRHLRDGLARQDWPGYYDHLNELAASGVRDDLTVDVGVPMSLVATYAARLPHAIEALEGPNEYGGTDPKLLSNLRSFQQLLYTSVKTMPALRSVTVLGPSFTSYEACMMIGSLAGSSDFGNMHDYFSSRNPGTSGWGSIYPPYGEYGSLAYNLGIVRHVYHPNRIVSTETGWDDGATYPPATYSVTPAVKARYTVRVLLEHWNAGVARTYLYELADEGGQSFGLVDGHGRTKPAYTALQTLLERLDDHGQRSVTGPLTYRISAQPDVHHTLLAKRDRSCLLLLWAEVPAIDPAVPHRTVSVVLPSGYHIRYQDAWRDDGRTDRSYPKAEHRTATLVVTDRVTAIDLVPDEVARFAPNSGPKRRAVP